MGMGQTAAATTVASSSWNADVNERVFPIQMILRTKIDFFPMNFYKFLRKKSINFHNFPYEFFKNKNRIFKIFKSQKKTEKISKIFKNKKAIFKSKINSKKCKKFSCEFSKILSTKNHFLKVKNSKNFYDFFNFFNKNR